MSRWIKLIHRGDCGTALIDLLIGSVVLLSCTIALTVGSVRSLALFRTVIGRVYAVRTLSDTCKTLQLAAPSITLNKLPEVIAELEQASESQINCEAESALTPEYKKVSCVVSILPEIQGEPAQEGPCLIVLK